MGKGGGTLGYHYIITLFMNLCRGPIDALVQIDVGDKRAWTGSASDATPTPINKSGLFGGEKKEGGIQGAFRLLQGADDQVLPGAVTVTVGSVGPAKSVTIPDIKAVVGVPMGEQRGRAMLLFRGLVCSMNPYPKEWAVRMRRSVNGWYGGTAWYPEKATICMTGDGKYVSTPRGFSSETDSAFGLLLRALAEVMFAAKREANAPDASIKAMNPAHIIYQCLTDPMWGAGIPADRLDENSFIAAANRLCAEGFGLCFNWSRQEDVQAFIQVVCDHIAGAVYIDPRTGKWTLRLIRGDYVLDDLPVYTFRSGLLKVEEEDNASGEESFNEIRVKGRDPVTNEDFEVAAHSIAGLQDPEAGVNSDPREYRGIPTRALALRVAERDLRPHAAGPKRYKLVFDRRAWTITPAMPVRIQAPGRGLDDIVLRLVDIDYGSPEKPTITAKAIEDNFAMGESAFGTVVPGERPIEQAFAFPAPRHDLTEATYREIYRRIGQTETENLSPTSAFISQMALAPTALSLEYDLASKAAGETEYTRTSEQPFNAWGDLAADIGPADTVVELGNNFGLDSLVVGEPLLLGGATGEVVKCVALSGTTLTIARGCLDTVPQSHAAGTSVWALDDTHGIDGRQYAEGEDVTTLVLTRTNDEVLEDDEATPETITLAARHARPYPPGNVTVDGTSLYELAELHAEPAIAFVDRDRVAQADQMVPFGDAGVGPEPGTTYTVAVYDEGDLVTPLRTTSGLASGTWTYDAAMQTADGDPVSVVVDISAQRDGLDSWQSQSARVNLKGGYGQAYGMDYGGA